MIFWGFGILIFFFFNFLLFFEIYGDISLFFNHNLHKLSQILILSTYTFFTCDCHWNLTGKLTQHCCVKSLLY